MVVFGDLFFDLSVGYFRGTLVEQPGACHDDSVLRIYFDEFANASKSFFENSSHFDVVVGDGSGSLEDGLELALREVGIVIEDFPESFFAGLFHSEFDGLDSAEGVFNQLGVTFFEERLEGFGVYRVLR